MPYALGTINAPGTLVAGYRRGDPIEPAVVDAWGLVEGEDFAADASNSTAGGLLTPRTGAAAGVDTVPGGSTIIARNTGAGSLTITLVNALTNDGLAVGNRTHTLAAGAVRRFNVNPLWADANGRVPIGVTTGTATDLTYYITN